MTTATSAPVRSVAPDELDLRFARLRLRCPPQAARVRRSVEREEVCPPVLASDGVAEGKLVLIDGFKRVEAVRDLGRKEIPVRVLSLDAVAAQAAIVSANAPQHGLSDLEEGLIVQSLHRTHGLSQVEIAKRLDHHKSWVCRRLALVEQLEPALQEDVRLGLLSATVVRELVRLPRGNRVRAARTIREYGLSSRQAGRLVRFLLVADPQAQEAALKDPLGYSMDGPGMEWDRQASLRRVPLGSVAHRLRGYLLRLRGASRATLDLLGEPSLSISAKERRFLAGLSGNVSPVVKEAVAALEKHLEVRKGPEHVHL